MPSAVARLVKSGDVVEIDAGLYEGDVAVWRADDLVIRAVGGRAHLRAGGLHAEGKAIWVIKGTRVTVENIELSGARVPDGNGAGIRYEGLRLTLRACHLHDNENGILTTLDPRSEVVIEYSEFANNGAGDGRTHNIYAGGGRFELRHSYVHHARVGHNVKSRARETYVLYSRIMDEDDGTASYAIDLPNGGRAFVIGNLIQQGPRTSNSVIVSYGAEGLMKAPNELHVVNNTVVNDRSEGGTFVDVRGTPARAALRNNIFAGRGVVLRGPGELVRNLSGIEPGLLNREGFDYRLRGDSPAIDAGVDPGIVHGFSLAPTAQYRHPANGEPRASIGPPDLGAHEYQGSRGR
ncbi:MAG: right-handed parallel beta-helix repeat-containing protein [Candidatus Rokuibacteriota bacterium]